MAMPLKSARLTLPPIDALPEKIRPAAEAAHDAAETWRAAQRHRVEAQQRLTAARDSYDAAVRDLDPPKTDRRPSLEVELERAQQVERQARHRAAGLWHRLTVEVQEQLTPEDLEDLDGPADDAARRYQAAIEDMEQARQELADTRALRGWLEPLIVPRQWASGIVKTYDLLGDYRPDRRPPSTSTYRTATGQSKTLNLNDCVQALRADATRLDRARAQARAEQERRHRDKAAARANVVRAAAAAEHAPAVTTVMSSDH